MRSVSLNAWMISGLFVIIFVSGFIMNRLGKPYNALLFTFHKMAAVAAAAYLIYIIRRIHQSAALTTGETIVVIVTGLLFIAALISGGLASLDKHMPAFVLLMHKIAPYATAAATAVMIFGLLGKR